jgi:predicted benzoate:H+ symporter BenE
MAQKEQEVTTDGATVVGVNTALWTCVFGVESSAVRSAADEWY